MTKRYCTMPNIPWFRDWFESKFGDLCYRHDRWYETKVPKLEADKWFCAYIYKRGYWYLVPFVFLAVNLPWVWWSYYKGK